MSLTIIPAIDLKDHQVVRLSQGKMGEAKVYDSNPLNVVQNWVRAGAKRIHLVDLNGAFEGKPIHFDVVSKMTKKYPSIQFEIGGGIRNLETIDRYFESGVGFCILGTAAIKNPELLKTACEKYPNKIILGLDAKDGMVATQGWDDVSSKNAFDFIGEFKNLKISDVIYTDVAKDGMMSGMNLESIEKMAAVSPFPIIGSGGLTSLDEIKFLRKVKNVSGVIAGKALYEGLFTLEEALSV